MQSQPSNQSTSAQTRTVLRVGDKAAYYIVKNSASRADIHVHRGVIFKIEKGRATLKFPTGRADRVWWQSLDFRGAPHELSRAISRSSKRINRALLLRTTNYSPRELDVLDSQV